MYIPSDCVSKNWIATTIDLCVELVLADLTDQMARQGTIHQTGNSLGINVASDRRGKNKFYVTAG
jgi:hypothetical protein